MKIDLARASFWIVSLLIGAYLLGFCVSKAFGEETIDWDRLVASVIEVESGGDPNAVSKYGAVGLMQITPICLEEINHAYNMNVRMSDLNDPILNKYIGLQYLQRLYYHYAIDDVAGILACYNGGVTRYKKVGRNINKMPAETREYVAKCLAIYNGGK